MILVVLAMFFRPYCQGLDLICFIATTVSRTRYDISVSHHLMFGVVKKNQSGQIMGAATGFILIDMLVRPILRFGFKFYFVGFFVLFLVYGFIAYKALQSAYLSEQQY